MGDQHMAINDENLHLGLEAWKKTIDVQQHFNDIEMRIRNLAVTVIVAIIGAAGLALREQMTINLLGFKTSFAVWLILAGLVAWGAFYLLDRWWYHRLLLASVRHGERLEAALKDKVPGISLTTTITVESRLGRWGRDTEQSHKRLDLFYGSIAAIMIAAALLLWFSA
jgi:hypothetical protein